MERKRCAGVKLIVRLPVPYRTHRGSGLPKPPAPRGRGRTPALAPSRCRIVAVTLSRARSSRLRPRRTAGGRYFARPREGRRRGCARPQHHTSINLISWGRSKALPRRSSSDRFTVTPVSLSSFRSAPRHSMGGPYGRRASGAGHGTVRNALGDPRAFPGTGTDYAGVIPTREESSSVHSRRGCVRRPSTIIRSTLPGRLTVNFAEFRCCCSAANDVNAAPLRNRLTLNSAVAACGPTARTKIAALHYEAGGDFLTITMLHQNANRVERRGVLTAREQQVITLVCQGLSNKEIARELGLSEGTVKQHVHRILVKTDLRNRGEIIVAAVLPQPGEIDSSSQVPEPLWLEPGP